MTEAEKSPHHEVEYEDVSKHEPQKCGNCSMLIGTEPNVCYSVKPPIYRAGWCIRWKPRYRIKDLM